MSEKNKKLFKLKSWDPSFFKKADFSCLLIGGRRAGKSNMIEHIYKSSNFKKLFDFVIVFCGSPDTMNKYQTFIHGDLFFDFFDPIIIERIKQMSRYYQAKNQLKRFLILFDDSISNSQKYSEIINEVYTRGRHDNISIIYTSQKLTMISTSARTNSDIVLIGNVKSAKEKRCVIDDYLMGTIESDHIKGIGELEFFKKLLAKNTVDYNFIVLDFTNVSYNDFEHTVFTFKAPLYK